MIQLFTRTSQCPGIFIVSEFTVPGYAHIHSFIEVFKALCLMLSLSVRTNIVQRSDGEVGSVGSIYSRDHLWSPTEYAPCPRPRLPGTPWPLGDHVDSFLFIGMNEFDAESLNRNFWSCATSFWWKRSSRASLIRGSRSCGRIGRSSGTFVRFLCRYLLIINRMSGWSLNWQQLLLVNWSHDLRWGIWSRRARTTNKLRRRPHVFPFSHFTTFRYLSSPPSTLIRIHPDCWNNEDYSMICWVSLSPFTNCISLNLCVLEEYMK